MKTLKCLLKQADVQHITFTGGEPLMAERFSEMVLFVRMKGIAVTVISNGNYGDIPAYKQLTELGVSLFELPVHSKDPGQHDYLTGHQGSWKRSVEAIKGLLNTKAEVVVVIVLTKANFESISDTLEYIHALGIRRVMLNRFNLGGAGIRETGNLLMSRAELHQAFRDAAEKANTLNLSVSSNVCTPVCVLNPKDFRGIQFTSCSFDFSSRPLTVDFSGNMRFCNHSPTVLGNIFEKSPEEILKSDIVAGWKQIVPSFCSDCIAWESCKAGCRAASEQMGLSLHHPDPIIELMGEDDALLEELKKGKKKIGLSE